MSDLTDRYVFVSGATAVGAPNNLSAKIDLGPIMERVPYTMVEVVSASILTATLTEDVYVFKTQEIAMNGYTCLWRTDPLFKPSRRDWSRRSKIISRYSTIHNDN